MGLLNLALGQLLGLFLPAAAFLVALYFYDRSRKRVLVSTLRFWPRHPAPATRQRHKRIQHPLSLLLQLAALLLFLLAIADPRMESIGPVARQHVILLDTSAAMALPDSDGEQLMPQAKTLALAYLGTIPGRDRVLLIEADNAPQVRVPFTEDRALLREAIQAAEPGWTALDLAAAFDLATGALRLTLDTGADALPTDPRVGETVYIGPGRLAGQPPSSQPMANVRYLRTGEPSDSVGLLELRAAADPAEQGKWDVEVRARSYESANTVATIEFYFDGNRLGHRRLDLPAGQDASLRFALRTRRPGQLRAQLAEPDAYAPNNEAAVSIPGTRHTKLQVLGASREEFEPLLASGGRVEPKFVDSEAEFADDAIHVWARGGDASPSRRAILLAPPGTESPLGEAGSVRSQPINRWSASHPLSRGVRDQDFIPSRARVFEAGIGDEAVAHTVAGPVILARSEDQRRLVAFGFDLTDESVRGRLAAPLLFANAIAWLDAAAFRPEAVQARPPGSVAIEAPNSAIGEIAVRTEDGEAIPWLLSEGSVRFYADRPGTYRVTTADRDLTLHLDQPQVASRTWEPLDVPTGLPQAAPASDEPLIPWPWLAGLGALLLLYDWIRFGRGRPLPVESLRTVSPEEAA